MPSILLYASALALGFSYGVTGGSYWYAYMICAIAWVACTALFYITPIIYRPKTFAVPLNPILPSFGVASSVFLIGTLSQETWVVWAYAMAAGNLGPWHLLFTGWCTFGRMGQPDHGCILQYAYMLADACKYESAHQTPSIYCMW